MPESCRIPVVCDRCREQGLAGADPFEAFGALLDFDPVPRKSKRADGWDAELQRAFIALYALTGSVKAACRAVGKSEFGITQLVRAEGSESFAAAMDEALAISQDERRRRLAEAVGAVTAERDAWRPPEPPWAKAKSRGGPALSVPAPPPGAAEWRDAHGYTKEERAKLDAFEPVFGYYVQRLAMERRARLAGKICEADFYVRQITVSEIVLQLMAGGAGEDAIREMQRLRAGPHRLNSIAETVMSRLLDDLRREQWAALGEPERPPPPGPEFLIDKGEVKLLRQECFSGPDWKEQMRAQDEAYAAAAREQVEWEANAAGESAAWRARLEAEAAAEQPDEAPENPSPFGGEGNAAAGGEGEGKAGTVTS